MNAREEARRMLEFARRDFKALGGMMATGLFDDEIYGFHAQQAVEKALKAWMILANKEYPKTHDLSVLLHLLEEIMAPGISKSFADLEDLTIFAVQYRYDTFESGDEPLDRSVLFERIKSLIEHVEGLFKV